MQQLSFRDNRSKVIWLYLIISLTLASVFMLLFLSNPKGMQSHVFFEQTEDYMADYYNVAKYSSDNNPYFNEFRGSYLPASYILFHYLSKFANYAELDAFSAGMSTMGLATSSFFMFVVSFTFIFILLRYPTGLSSTKNIMLGLILIFSGIFIFAYERGNLIIPAATFSTIFLFYYKSEKKVIKELAFFSLALAASLKGYPAVYGLLLLYDRKYKEAIRLVIYGILVAFLPFLLIEGGFQNIPQFINNFFYSNDIYLYRSYPRFGHYYFVTIWAHSRTLKGLLEKEVVNSFLTIILHVFIIAGLFVMRRENLYWRKVAILTCIILFLPTNSGLYCGLYFFPVIILFFSNIMYEKKIYYYLALFIIFLNPIQFIVIRYGINLNTFLINISVILMYFGLLFSPSRSVTEFTKK